VDVQIRLGHFVNETLGPDVGFIWSDPGGSAVIRLAEFDADGYGISLIARSCGAATPSPTQSSNGVWQSIENVLSGISSSSSRIGATRDYSMQRTARAMADPKAETFSQFVDGHSTVFDGVGTAFDVAGMIAGFGSFAAILGGSFALLPALGAAAFVGCVLLSATDGPKFLLEISGDQAKAESYHDSDFFQWTQTIAPLLILPDAVFHAPKEIAALGKEAKSLKAEIPKLQQEGSKIMGDLSKAKAEHASTLADHPRGAPPLSQEEARLRQNELQQQRRHMKKLTDQVAAMQNKIEHAKFGLISKAFLLKANQVAIRGTGYASGMYVAVPTDPIQNSFSWAEARFSPRSAGPTFTTYHIAFHIAITSQAGNSK